ncbi:NRDE family protein [Shewanella sp. YIC-542]|uniref:NRDE family protein n=1 Tax=Shewanella mytili TaxID=3377111 RepID=UPI00398F6420
MCILFIALQQHPDYPLILCANRDEYHQRPTQAAHFWPGQPQLLAGKDLTAGGSWLGINRQGAIAALTNIRAPHLLRDNCPSRGALVINALRHGITAQWLRQHRQEYNPFNLLYGSANGLFCCNSLSGQIQPLTPGYHAISNGALDDIWPKMARGTQALQQLIGRQQTVNSNTLLDIMRDETQANAGQLPTTGIDRAWEQKLSSIFIQHPDYGTRSTTVLLQHRTGNVEFLEVRYAPNAQACERHRFQFSLLPS